MDRSQDWLRQAERDLEQARWSLEGGYPELACFLSQQAAQKAVKALCQAKKVEARGHMITRLLEAVSVEVTAAPEVLSAAKALDRHYIPARYPNSFETGTPADYYTSEDAQDAIGHAQRIIEFCQQHL